MSLAAAPAWAHPHRVDSNRDGVINEADQELANGQNHGKYVNGVSCGGDPAAYGLESAHHGPDSGDPGKADGCYESDDKVNSPEPPEDENPAIG
ncbi:MAG TPA: hypothetical protein VMP13_03850 [Acidimicrobiia bacterium]|nr:hypothetical protein [Acidimicrobiia bacterium]